MFANPGLYFSTDNAKTASPTATSPAALFLATFSPPPPPPPSAAADVEGQVVAGLTLGPIIAYGGTSTIRRATSASTGAVVAVKIVPRRRGTGTTTAHHEERIWTALSHEHVLPLFACVRAPMHTFFVTQLCPAGSLYDVVLRGVPRDDAGRMFRQVVRGLRYLHVDKGLVHRDLKLENVLVDDAGVCRIADFGMARGVKGFAEWEDDVSEEEDPHMRPGSLPYAAPELLGAISTPAHPHPAQDMWALGVLLYALLTGRLPFTDPFEPRLVLTILSGTYPPPSATSERTLAVLRGCLAPRVADRWAVDRVDAAAWVVGGDDDEATVGVAG